MTGAGLPNRVVETRLGLLPDETRVVDVETESLLRHGDILGVQVDPDEPSAVVLRDEGGRPGARERIEGDPRFGRVGVAVAGRRPAFELIGVF